MSSDKLILELTDSYLKFKSYVYHENFSVGLKKELAMFEIGFNRKIKKLSIELQKTKDGNNSTFIKNLIEKISFSVLPKSFATQEYELSGGSFYSNKNNYTNYEIDDIKKIIPFINCEIELHIIATLWVIKIGVKLDKELHNTCYANRLYDLKKATQKDRLKLFKRYYYNYNNWRDTAIKTARKIHADNNNVAILSLDIQNYYHSIDLNLSKLYVNKNLKWLNQILIDVHSSYIDILSNHNILEKPKKNIIPIGLTSSNILANFYLKRLDQTITQKTRPAFYGRYVDDFIIVYKNPIINDNSKDVVFNFINENLSSKTKNIENAYIQPDGRTSFKIIIDKNEMKFQLKKVKLYYFVSSSNKCNFLL